MCHHKFPTPLKDVNLWIDSTDILITNASDRGARSDYWSGKEKHPAWRFMVVRDGKGRLRKLWGGYYPSTHDNSFMTSHHDEVEELFNGGVIIGDTHFSACMNSFRNPKFYAPKAIHPPKKSKKRRRGQDDTESDDEENLQLTKKSEKWNNDVHKVRGKVELVFAWLKNHFRALHGVWAEPLDQLSWLVKFAIGVHFVVHN